MIKGYATTPLGQLHYVEAGNGVPILLLHQTPRSFDEFAEVLPLLATSHRRSKGSWIRSVWSRRSDAAMPQRKQVWRCCRCWAWMD